MLQRLTKATLAFGITASLMAAPLARPAAASTGSTYTMIEAGLALIGGIILYNNYEHKRQAANSVVGYTANGGRVYGDGRIVMPNGTTIYPGRDGRYSWGQYAYYSPRASGYRYDYNRSGRYYQSRPRYDRDDVDRDDYVRASRSRSWHEHGHRGRGHHHGGGDHDGGDRD